MKQIDRDVKRIVTLREQYSSLKVILLVNISLPSFQTTGNDLENRYLLSVLIPQGPGKYIYK